MLFNDQTPLHFIDEEMNICGILGWKIKSNVTERNLSQQIVMGGLCELWRMQVVWKIGDKLMVFRFPTKKEDGICN